ncbi:hypothetical protein, partial [Klebsiella aerogenes]|uniref:hypothetical protein n=1 Tax=Klebsiella aerogenes TaxID=548 RepID=UPI0019538B3D
EGWSSIALAMGSVVDKKMTFGQNIGWIGSDIPKNSIILRKGEVISHEKIGRLASLGISKLE